jgi:hypothetical protein
VVKSVFGLLRNISGNQFALTVNGSRKSISSSEIVGAGLAKI